MLKIEDQHEYMNIIKANANQLTSGYCGRPPTATTNLSAVISCCTQRKATHADTVHDTTTNANTLHDPYKSVTRQNYVILAEYKGSAREYLHERLRCSCKYGAWYCPSTKPILHLSRVTITHWYIQWNLTITTTPGAGLSWSYYRGGLISEIPPVCMLGCY